MSFIPWLANNFVLFTGIIQIIVASIRNPVHVLEAALMGADAATIPLKIIEQLVKHPLTDIGIDKFLEDAKRNV